MGEDRGVVSTPGEVLLEEFMRPLGIDRAGLAEAIGETETVVSWIVDGTREIDQKTAHLLSEALGTTPDFWLNLERTYRSLLGE